MFRWLVFANPSKKVLLPAFSQNWATLRKMPANSFTSLCNNYDVNRLIFNELIKYSQQANLKHFEMVSLG